MPLRAVFATSAPVWGFLGTVVITVGAGIGSLVTYLITWWREAPATAAAVESKERTDELAGMKASLAAMLDVVGPLREDVNRLNDELDDSREEQRKTRTELRECKERDRAKGVQIKKQDEKIAKLTDEIAELRGLLDAKSDK